MNNAPRLAILAIDDNPADLELLRYYLEEIPDFDITAHAFTNPDEGMAWLKDHSADLILLDYFLGAVSGLDVYEEIQAAGILSPVILLTGRGDEEVAVSAMRAGITDYLPKNGLSSNNLARALTNAIEKHELREKVEAHRNKLEETVRDLRRKNEEVKSFYHTLSHELKTPLTSAREFIYIVMDGLAGEIKPTQLHYLGISLSCCDQMALYITDLLDASRLETGKLPLMLKPHSLASVVNRVVTSLAAAADGKKIKLVCNVSQDVPEVHIDDKRIVQVLTNLVNNAIKFTPAGGEVVIGAEEPEDDELFVAVTVTDSGYGIPPDKLELIFDRLFQVNKVDHGSAGGLGLGLFLARELVRLHHGTITVSSRVGEGSTFSFTVPKCVAVGAGLPSP